ncbi:MAG: hypothetical protein V1776_00050 [Candidatus Diapherotrites archaeon]
MQTKSWVDAEEHVGKALEGDRHKAVKAVALQGAQIKFVIRKLQSQMHKEDNLEIVKGLESFIPPMNEDLLLAYALSSPERFEKEMIPLLKAWGRRNPNSLIEKWIEEMEEALLIARRVVVQNLSKHPGMKPYHLFQRIGDAKEELIDIERNVQENEDKIHRIERELKEAREEKETHWSHPRAETLRRLLESREKLLQRKQEWIIGWNNAWEKIRPVLERMANHPETFERLENAQLRMLQLYLANPANARQRDVHGAGLLMLLQWMVRTLEEKISFSLAETADMRDALASALEDGIFTTFFEKNAELDHAIELNQQEYMELPLYKVMRSAEMREVSARQELNKIKSAHAQIKETVHSKQGELNALFAELNEHCERHLGFSVARE